MHLVLITLQMQELESPKLNACPRLQQMKGYCKLQNAGILTVGTSFYSNFAMSLFNPSIPWATSLEPRNTGGL